MKIEKCPFCGGEAKLKTARKSDGQISYDSIYVACLNCRSTGLSYTTYYNMSSNPEEQAIAAWNRRADHIRDTTKKVSNADRIRNMSDEELARWLVDANMCERVCNEDEYCHGNECIERVISWLQQPAETEE